MDICISMRAWRLIKRWWVYSTMLVIKYVRYLDSCLDAWAGVGERLIRYQDSRGGM
jgi:hypothetical protein